LSWTALGVPSACANCVIDTRMGWWFGLWVCCVRHICRSRHTHHPHNHPRRVSGRLVYALMPWACCFCPDTPALAPAYRPVSNRTMLVEQGGYPACPPPPLRRRPVLGQRSKCHPPPSPLPRPAPGE
jgi:hypothetical protein